MYIRSYDNIDNLSIYRIFSFNKSHTKALNGTIEFNTSDKAKTTLLLEDILNSVKFK